MNSNLHKTFLFASCFIFLLVQIACSHTEKNLPIKHLNEIMQLHSTNNGSTYCMHLQGNMTKTPYYAVGVFPEKGLTLKRKLERKDLEGFLKKYRAMFQKNYCLGTWIEKGQTVYLDIVKVIPHTAGKNTALQLAKEHRQIAIYDLLNQQVINIKH